MNLHCNPLDTGKTPGWRTYLGLAVLFCFPLLFYVVLFIQGGNTIIFEDGLLYSFPLRVFLHSAFTEGQSPQWMPYAAGGFSLLAEGQSGLCLPTTQILYRLFSAESAWLIESFLGLLSAFIACLLLLRRLSVGTLAAMFGASVYAFSIQSVIGLIVPSMMWSYALLPLLLHAFLGMAEGRRGAFFESVIACTLLLLTGHPVMIVYIGMIAAAFTLFAMLSGRAVGRMVKLPLIAAGGLAIAVLIALPQLLPMMELYPISARTAGAVSVTELQNTLHMDPSWIPRAFFPVPFDLTQPDSFLSILIRYPLFPVCLALAGVFASHKPAKWFFAGLGLFLLLLALGPHAGVWKWVHSVPVLRHFRFPFRWLFFVPICVSVLAAFGLDQLCRYRAFTARRDFRWLLRCLFVLFFVALAFLIIRKHEIYLGSAKSAFASQPFVSAVLCLSALGMIAAVLLTTGRAVRPAWIGAGIGLTLVSLLAVNTFILNGPYIVNRLDTIGWPWQMHKEPQVYRTAAAHSPYSIWRSDRVDDLYAYTPNLSLLDGRLHINHYCSFIPYWASDMSGWCRQAADGQQEWRNMLNVSSSRWLALKDKSKPVDVPPGVELYEVKLAENVKAVPRAVVVRSYIFCEDDQQVIDSLKSPGFDPGKTAVLLAGDRSEAVQNSDQSSPAAEARIVVDRSDRVEIAVAPALTSESLLVLSDTFYPGWKAFVDGVEKPILRTNYAFRGVPLPAGAERVVFRFEPLVPDWVLVLPTIVLAGLGMLLFRRIRSGKNADKAVMP